jgi:hypothetical protein
MTTTGTIRVGSTVRYRKSERGYLYTVTAVGAHGVDLKPSPYGNAVSSRHGVDPTRLMVVR